MRVAIQNKPMAGQPAQHKSTNICNNTVILEIREGSHFNLNYSFTLPNGINARPFFDYACMKPTQQRGKFLFALI